MAPTEVVDINSFVELATRFPVFDVRTAAEFDKGHIPSAQNLELFSNDERASIGITYKQDGRQEAVLQGLDLVGPRMRGLIEIVRNTTDARSVLVHCWRGGMRSKSVAWLLSTYGYRVYLLDGGYKSYRRHVLNCLELPQRVVILSGYTGSGKTEILGHLREQGEQIIDLEGLANHKGSAFGDLGEAPQPTQQQFENILASEWRNLDATRPVWLEDESARVGQRQIPAPIRKLMRSASVIFLEMPRELRVGRLITDYGSFGTDELCRAIDLLSRRMGTENTRKARNFVESGELEKCSQLLLEAHYDKAYLHGLSRRDPSTIHKVPTQVADAAENARLLIRSLKKNVTPSTVSEAAI